MWGTPWASRRTVTGAERTCRPGQMHVAVELGQRGLGGGAKPQHARAGGQQQKNKQAGGGPRAGSAASGDCGAERRGAAGELASAIR